MHLRPENAVKCLLVCCCFHNLLPESMAGTKYSRVDIEDPLHHDVVEGDWHQEEQALLLIRKLDRNIAGNQISKDQRNSLIDYNNGVGSVPCQNGQIDPQYLKKRKKLNQRPHYYQMKAMKMTSF